MKIFLTIALVSLSFLSNAQTQHLPIDSIKRTIKAVEIIKVDGATKDQLFNRARVWFAQQFISANDVIQTEDKEAGVIIAKGLTKGSYNVMFNRIGYNIFYTLRVAVKDNRYKYEIYEFTYQQEPGRNIVAPPKTLLDSYYFDPENRNKKGEWVGARMPAVVTHLSEVIKKIKDDLNTALKTVEPNIADSDDF